MKYVKVKTPQGELLYSPEEKHLYSRHDTSKSIGVWTCYQKTICKRKVNKYFYFFIYLIEINIMNPPIEHIFTEQY